MLSLSCIDIVVTVVIYCRLLLLLVLIVLIVIITTVGTIITNITQGRSRSVIPASSTSCAVSYIVVIWVVVKMMVPF